ncbi:protein angel isoform X2 [Rhodnius prolixus]|uniref:protein angel isoform X2 n=1 Tax=Rhodnius prolixus TaxID=13249 RepID=UPI003D18ED23
MRKKLIYLWFLYLIGQNSAIKEEKDTDEGRVTSALKRIRQEEVMAEQDKTSKTYSVDRQLKVMNYNVLAQDLIDLHSNLYENHAPEYLAWETRSRLLMDQITTFLPDILSLQEVQESHIGPFYKQLEKYGYRGVFKRRTGNKTDGCALYYMSTLLELVEYQTVEFYRPHISPTLLNRPNVAIVARLRSTSKPPRLLGKELIVANTHLLYNPRRSDVRVAQIQILLAEIHKISTNMGSKEPAVLLMGDLNSWPDSPVIKLLENGRVSSYFSYLPSGSGISNHCTFVNNNKGEDNEKNKLLNGDTCDISSRDEFLKKADQSSQSDLTHSFHFNSVYNWKNKNNHSLATSYQGRWNIVDYIFYSRNIKLISRLKLPTVEECEHEIGWIPNKTSPSDHFPLAATFIVE